MLNTAPLDNQQLSSHLKQTAWELSSVAHYALPQMKKAARALSAMWSRQAPQQADYPELILDLQGHITAETFSAKDLQHGLLLFMSRSNMQQASDTLLHLFTQTFQYNENLNTVELPAATATIDEARLSHCTQQSVEANQDMQRLQSTLGKLQEEHDHAFEVALATARTEAALARAEAPIPPRANHNADASPAALLQHRSIATQAAAAAKLRNRARQQRHVEPTDTNDATVSPITTPH